jgi:hypothetical protein
MNLYWRWHYLHYVDGASDQNRFLFCCIVSSVFSLFLSFQDTNSSVKSEIVEKKCWLNRLIKRVSMKWEDIIIFNTYQKLIIIKKTKYLFIQKYLNLIGDYCSNYESSTNIKLYIINARSYWTIELSFQTKNSTD